MFWSFLFLFSRRTKRVDVREGAFVCPHCESQQSCVGYTQMRGRQHEGEFVQCLKCEGKWRGGDYRYEAATKVFEPVLWECPSCKAQNPNDVFRCRRCYKSLV